MGNKIIDIYKDLFDTQDIMETLCKYIAYSKCGLVYDFGSTTIPKATKLYRIRKYSPNIDFSDPKQWTPSPNKNQNRCNTNGETALYLGSTELVCLLETNIQQNEKYVLAEYEITEDIEVGGFIYVNPNESRWKFLVAVLFNAFLIAPSRNSCNEHLFDILDNYFSDTDFSNIRLDTITNPKENVLLSLRIGCINQKNKYYNITNEMCNILKTKTPKGIRYSSCFIPMETVGIQCSEYNVCLYESALKSIKFLKSDIKVNTKKYTSVDMVKLLLETEKENEKQ